MATKSFQKTLEHDDDYAYASSSAVTDSTALSTNGSGVKGAAETISLPFGVLGGGMKNRRPRVKNKVVDETTDKAKGCVEQVKEIEIRACPQCQVEFDGVKCCPIQEACGHIKCRACFIRGLGKGDNYCQQCELNSGVEIEPKKSYENTKRNIKAADSTTCLVPVTVNLDGDGKKHGIRKRRNKISQQLDQNATSSSVPVSLRVSNGISDSLKVTLKIQSKDDNGNAAQARIKKPVQVHAKRKNRRHHVNIPDHVITIQSCNEDPVRYKCTVCNKSFKTKGHIKYHAYCSKDGSASIEKPFQCDQCDNSFVARSHFEYHLRTHSGERPYECKVCGKGFNQRGKVTRHMRTHTGEKPFICQQCGRGFANAQALRSHFLIHTGERPFACQYCPKRFTGMTNLKKHVITHTGERPYSCGRCPKSFGLKWTLDLHLKTHSGELPFPCATCFRGFSNKKDLRRHLVVHSGERPFKCTICGSAFKRKDNLDRHLRNTHNYQVPNRKNVSAVKRPPNRLRGIIKKQVSKIKLGRVKKNIAKKCTFSLTNATKMQKDKAPEMLTITACEVIQPNNTRANEELSISSHSQLEEVINHDCDDAFIFNALELSEIKREVREAESVVEDLVRKGFCQTTGNKNISQPLSNSESQAIDEIVLKQEPIDTDVNSESNLRISCTTMTLVIEEDGSTHLVL